jgi:hypothetical protein
VDSSDNVDSTALSRRGLNREGALNQKAPFSVSPLLCYAVLASYTRAGGGRVKKPPTKQDVRKRLEKQVAAFLSEGGKVQELKTGESAYDRRTIPPITPPVFEARQTSRTPLNDVIAALDARRAEKRSRTKIVRRRTPKRKKQVVYDDFGEPLRVVWIEE